MTSRMSPIIRVTFSLLAIVFATSATTENNIVTMLTSNEGVYNTTVTWKIENFLEMPYAKTHFNKHGGPFFKSEPFPEQSVNGVKWHFYLERNGSETLDTKDNDTSINLMLIFKAPQKIASFAGSCRCGIVNVNGVTGLGQVTSVKEVTAKDPFVFYPFVSLNQLKNSNDLLPNGDLTVQCFIEGHLMLNMTSTNDFIPTKMIESINIGLCGSKIAQENLKILSKLENYYVLPVHGHETFYIIRQILHQRVPALSRHSREWNTSNEDFETKTEVKDFLTFVVKGEADNLEETCPRLYKVAQKYDFECLMNTCGKIMKIFQ